MSREKPLDSPSLEAVETATASVLGRSVATVNRIEEGLNAVYRIDFTDGSRAVLKAATLTKDAELLSESLLLERLRRETTVPVPAVLAAVSADDGPLGMAYVLTDHCDGRKLTDVLALTPTAHERLVREAGRYLAAIHDLRMDQYGTLRAVAGQLTVVPRYESWGSWFAELSTAATAGLTGEGYYTDDAARFADLSQLVRAVLTEAATNFDDQSGPAVLHHDYRPANLIIADTDDVEPFTRAVLDFEACPVGDGLLDLALAEDALIDIPLGETKRADHLRTVLRTAYTNGQDIDYSVFDARYPYYRLYARARRLGSFDYWVQFAREDDTDAVAHRWRSFISDRLDTVG